MGVDSMQGYIAVTCTAFANMHESVLVMCEFPATKMYDEFFRRETLGNTNCSERQNFFETF